MQAAGRCWQREEVGSLAFSLPFPGFPWREFLGGRPQTWGRKSAVSTRLETACSHHGGEEGTPPRARPEGRGPPRATGPCSCRSFPQGDGGMFAHRGPKSARVEKEHMESITASTCGLEKSALSPHHPLLPAISERLFLSPCKKYGVIQYTVIPLSCLHEYCISGNQIPQRGLLQKTMRAREEPPKKPQKANKPLQTGKL